MKLNARKMAVWVIAFAIMWVVVQLVSDGEWMLQSVFGGAVLVLGMLFRGVAFRKLHALIENTVDTQAERLFGVTDEPAQEFDAQAIIDRHLASRAASEGHAVAETPTDASIAPVTRPVFGRKGA